MSTKTVAKSDVLTPQEEAFVHNVVILRMTKSQAVIAAGYKNKNHAANLMERPAIVRALNELRAEVAEQFAVSRTDVVEGLFEAIGFAKLLNEPSTMINGWREIAKITDNYELDRDKEDLTDRQKKVLSMLEDMPEERLLELCEKDVAVLDGEFKEVHEGADRPSRRALGKKARASR